MTSTSVERRSTVPVAVVATVIFLTAIAPLATDMYVPAFPRVAQDLGVGAAAVQLTLTTFFVGMGFGQLVGGPVSDQRGRRRLLLVSTLVACAGSIACALAPSIGVLTAARLVQGFSGGWAMVVGRAVIVDLARGGQLVRVLNVISGVGGIAPIVGPLLGAAIIQLSGWRTSFWVVAGLAAAMACCVGLLVPESLPPSRRHAGGLRAFRHAGREVLTHRIYVGYVMVSASAMISLFAYVATSAFILESMNGLSPIAYSVDFAANAAAMTVTALTSARLAGRVSTRRLILIGQLMALAAGLAMLAGALWAQTPLLLALACFFALMAAQGLVGPNGGALAAAAVPDHPGTGSAVLGLLQWVAAGTVAPIAGLGGTTSAVPMALLMVVGAGVSMLGLLVVARPQVPPAPLLPHDLDDDAVTATVPFDLHVQGHTI